MNPEEILEEFEAAAHMGRRFWTDGNSRVGDGLNLMPLFEPKPRDLAQEFLEADEEKRAEMRKIPVPRGLYIDPPKPLPRRCIQGSDGNPRTGVVCKRALTDEEVAYIRKVGPINGRASRYDASSISCHELASMFGVSRMTIYRVRMGHIYKQTGPEVVK